MCSCIPRDDSSGDKDRLILFRGVTCFVIMNKFPYNNGHLMVCPYRHVSCITELTENEAVESVQLIRRCVTVYKQALAPHGINVGLNLGEAAGAGIAAHLHWQLVPRWNGDASFMAVFGETNVIPDHLESTYQRLKPFFETN